MKEYQPFIQACRWLLSEYPGAYKAQEYLDSRVNRESQEKFQIGFHPTNKEYECLLSILGEDLLLRAKLRYERLITDGAYQKIKTNTFEHHSIVLPYRDVYGNIAAIVGRTLFSAAQQSELQISKYKNTSFEKKNHVFGLYEGKHEALRRNHIFVVEGQFDVITAHQYGIENVVALGSSNLTASQLALMLRYTDTVYLLLDNDEAGIIGMERALRKFGKTSKISAKVIPAGYKDLDDLLRAVPNMRHHDLQNLSSL